MDKSWNNPWKLIAIAMALMIVTAVVTAIVVANWTGTRPAQQIASEISSLQTKISWLQDSVRLSKARDAVEDVQTNIHGMAQRIAALRSKGYVFEKDLETQAQSFVGAWALLCPNVQTQINVQSTNLMNALRPVEMQMPQLSAMALGVVPAVAKQFLRLLDRAAPFTTDFR